MNQPFIIKQVSASHMKKTMIVTNASQETSSQKEKRRIRHPTLLTIQPLIFTEDLLAEAVPAKRKNILCLQITVQTLNLLMSQKKLENCMMKHHKNQWQFQQAHKHSILFLVIQLLVHASALKLLYFFLVVFSKYTLVMN